ncbi:MAG: hypothetical protein H6Q33_4304 [Deltaproteobacteria bacterium]|nr:hypothetical protein [Deltaproteobacteria bacterium]
MLEDWPRTLRGEPRYAPTLQQVATEQIGDRQRITSLAVARPEPSFVINSPHLVRMRGRAQCRPHCADRATAPTPCHDQSLPLEDRSRRARCRPWQIGRRAFQARHQLARSPEPMLFTRRNHLGHQLRRRRVRMMQRCARTIPQPFEAAVPIPLPPFVATLATDPERLTQLPHVPTAVFSKPGSDEFHSFLFHTGLLPRHRHPPVADTCRCYPCPRSTLLPICPVCTPGLPLPRSLSPACDWR